MRGKRRKFSADYKANENGQRVADPCRKLGIGPATFFMDGVRSILEWKPAN